MTTQFSVTRQARRHVFLLLRYCLLTLCVLRLRFFNTVSSSDNENDQHRSADELFHASDHSDSEEAENRPRSEGESIGSYSTTDPGPCENPPKFEPVRVPGVQLPDDVRTRADYQRYLTPFSFFQLFFTLDIVQHLCNWTNRYAQQQGPDKPTLYRGWTDITPDEMYVYFALLFYMVIVMASNVECYWSTASLYHGLWARHFMTMARFKAIQSFVKACDADTENNTADKLCKVHLLHDYIYRRCKKLYQPYRNVSIDERMVRNRGRFTFKQFIKDNPTRWGMRLWVVADACNDYTYDFEVYTGKGVPVSRNGLAYEFVMRLCTYLENQGYHIYFDNVYTGVQLVKDLLLKKKNVCYGTLQAGRKGVPAVFKDTKLFAKGTR